MYNEYTGRNVFVQFATRYVPKHTTFQWFLESIPFVYNVPGVFFCLASKASTREEKRERKEDTYSEETLTTSIH